MSRRAVRTFLVVASAAVLFAGVIACGVNMGPVVASHDEYRLWRKIRLAAAKDEKVRLLHRYLADYPEGHFAKRAAREEEDLDRRFYEAGMTEIDGLSTYLGLFPEGRNREQAEYRLAELLRLQEESARIRAEAVRRREEMEARLEERRRTWCWRTFDTWLHVLAGVAGWGDPLDVVLGRNVTFATAWNGDPAPACEAELCRKDLSHAYHIAVRGATRVDRTMRFLVRLRLAAAEAEAEAGGRFVAAELVLPEGGLLACQELADQREIDPEDPEAVGEALEKAGATLVDVVRRSFPEPPPPAEGEEPDPAAAAPPEETIPPNRFRLERLVRGPLVVEVWRGAGASEPETADSPRSELDADGVRIRFVPPEPERTRPGRRAPAKTPAKTKRPPAKAAR